MVHTVQVSRIGNGALIGTVDIYPCGKGSSKDMAIRAAVALFDGKGTLGGTVIASRPV